MVTKAGALTCAEALALERPLLLVHSLPGQEQANQAAIREGGAGVVVTRSAPRRSALGGPLGARSSPLSPRLGGPFCRAAGRPVSRGPLTN